MKNLLTKKDAFSLLEILLVLALLGFIISFFAKDLFDQFSGGQVKAAKIAIKRLESDLDMYRYDCNRYPSTAQGLKALVEEPTEPPTCEKYNPKGYGHKAVPKDPWDHEYKYVCDDGLNYEIISLGADGEEGGEGVNADISSNDA